MKAEHSRYFSAPISLTMDNACIRAYVCGVRRRHVLDWTNMQYVIYGRDRYLFRYCYLKAFSKYLLFLYYLWISYGRHLLLSQFFHDFFVIAFISNFVPTSTMGALGQ